jgi:uncharacterized phage protein (TIGR02218 family)
VRLTGIANESAFYAKMQAPGQQLVEIIDLVSQNRTYHWTTFDSPLTVTRSLVATEYQPLPGDVTRGLQEDSNMSVAIINFILANTGELLQELLVSDDISHATIQIGRVFADTPDLGRMFYFEGTMGNYSYDRHIIKGEARNKWGGLSQEFPFYTFKDTCTWRFGGPGCGFDPTSVTFAVPVDSIDITSSTNINILLGSGTLQQSYSDGWLDYGRVTVTDGVNSGFIRTIRSHTGDLLRLSHPLTVNSLADMALSVYPGCRKRLLEDCHSKYNNSSAFMGFPWIPIQEDII